MSAGGMAASQNVYAKAYNGIDFMTYVTTEKSIKKHVYDNAINTLKKTKRFNFKLD
jgi:hypothetical protein